jgi:hypothetical protein
MPALVKLEDHVSGDTWQGVAIIGPIQIQSGDTLVDFPYPVSSARMKLTKQGCNKTPLTVASSGECDAPITITSAPTWAMAIPPVSPDIWTPNPGRYSGHFEVTDTQGTVLTIYDIHLNVIADKTPS